MDESEGLDVNTFIYGTGNPAKLSHMRNMLTPIEVKIVGLKETGMVFPEVDENGSTPLENARIKALAYYKILKCPVFACDSGLYIDGLPEAEQPGVHVRMINGKRLNDEEMTAHYAKIAKRLGGKAVARYRNAICLVMNDGETYEHFGDDIASCAFYLVETPHPKRVEGFPLDCMSVRIETSEYYYDETASRADGDIYMNKGFQAFFERVTAQHNVINHYDALIDENNDPVHDPEPLKAYMDNWDGEVFFEAMQLTPDKSVLEIGVGTGRLAMRICDKCENFTGIDISPKTIERSKENLHAFQNVCLIHGDFIKNRGLIPRPLGRYTPLLAAG